MKLFSKSLFPDLLILLFIYAAASKLLRFGLFHDQLYNQAFPHSLADILLYAIPISELAVVILLLCPKSRLAGLLLSLTLLNLFTGYIALTLLHWWSRAPCSCGGILSRMTWTEHLLFNCLFLLINIAAIVIHFKERRAVT